MHGTERGMKWAALYTCTYALYRTESVCLFRAQTKSY